MNKLSLIGLRDLNIEETIDKNTDYGIFLIGSLVEIATPCTFEDTEKDFVKYKLKVERVDSVIDLKTKTDIKFEHGKSSSQKMRWAIEQNLGATEYDFFMKYLMGRIDGLCEDYREQLSTGK